uniref:NADH dehydrogenase subunit 4 n=1 Tax=Aconurella diplachnis TaxID=2855833 RepID=UPI0024357DD1|nr:NADH dehydrogenase subunit 4 [Aconurella diplachnis]WEU77738.1 NADH dehydrogenase subunit 4 [Aconurella diplachnis]
MMKFLLCVFFVIPVCFYSSSVMWIQYVFVLLYFFLLVSGCYSFMGSISFFLGLDNYSYGLILLSLLISSFMVVSMMKSMWICFFMFLNVLMLIFLMLIFSSMNFLYMYISFEFVLVPLVILILGWGYQPERLMAGMYLFFYTMLVSLPLFIVMMWMYMSFGSMTMELIKLTSDFFIIHFILVIVFMVKMPMYFVHFWLPKAHVQAPVSGSMILAGLMLKIGGYGLIRTMFMYEYMFISYSYIWFVFSLLGSLYISMICLIQADIKSMIAYSSISHMGMVIMGLLTMTLWGLTGSYLLMLGHGFCSSGMFYISNMFYLRTGSRSFYINKGLISYMPSCCMFWFLFCSFNMSCPPSINFISEFMILSSIMNYWFNSLYFFVGVSFFCAAFSYYLYSFSQHGLYSNFYSFSSLSLIEFLILLMHLIPLLTFPLLLSILM